MGEAAATPQNNENNVPDDHNEEDEEMETDEEEEEEMSPEEFLEIDNHLNALNSALDDIEKRNDDLNAKLIELLQANRQIRMEMQNEDAQNSSKMDEESAS